MKTEKYTKLKERHRADVENKKSNFDIFIDAVVETFNNDDSFDWSFPPHIDSFDEEYGTNVVVQKVDDENMTTIWEYIHKFKKKDRVLKLTRKVAHDHFKKLEEIYCKHAINFDKPGTHSADYLDYDTLALTQHERLMYYYMKRHISRTKFGDDDEPVSNEGMLKWSVNSHTKAMTKVDDKTKESGKKRKRTGRVIDLTQEEEKIRTFMNQFKETDKRLLHLIRCKSVMIGALERKIIREHFNNDEDAFRSGLENEKHFSNYEKMKKRDKETKKSAELWDKFSASVK